MTTTNNRPQAPSGGCAHACAPENARQMYCPAVYTNEFATADEACAYMAARGFTVTPPAPGEHAVVVAVESMAGMREPLFIMENTGDAITLWLGAGDLLECTEDAAEAAGAELIEALATFSAGVFRHKAFRVQGNEGRTLQ